MDGSAEDADEGTSSCFNLTLFRFSSLLRHIVLVLIYMFDCVDSLTADKIRNKTLYEASKGRLQ